MSKNIEARRRNRILSLVSNPENKVNFVITPIISATSTSLEYAVTFQDLEEGYYDINFITMGLQEWKNNLLEQFYFD